MTTTFMIFFKNGTMGMMQVMNASLEIFYQMMEMTDEVSTYEVLKEDK